MMPRSYSSIPRSEQYGLEPIDRYPPGGIQVPGSGFFKAGGRSKASMVAFEVEES